MKKVALLADGWRRLVTYSWVDGIMKVPGRPEKKYVWIITAQMEHGVMIRNLTMVNMHSTICRI